MSLVESPPTTKPSWLVGPPGSFATYTKYDVHGCEAGHQHYPAQWPDHAPHCPECCKQENGACYHQSQAELYGDYIAQKLREAEWASRQANNVPREYRDWVCDDGSAMRLHFKRTTWVDREQQYFEEQAKRPREEPFGRIFAPTAEAVEADSRKTEHRCGNSDEATIKKKAYKPRSKKETVHESVENHRNKVKALPSPISPIAPIKTTTYVYKPDGDAKILIHISSEPQQLVTFVVEKSLIKQARNWAKLSKEGFPTELPNGFKVPTDDSITTGFCISSEDHDTIRALRLIMEVLHFKDSASFSSTRSAKTLALLGWLSHEYLGLEALTDEQGKIWAKRLISESMETRTAVHALCVALRFDDRPLWRNVVLTVTPRLKLDKEGHLHDEYGKPLEIPGKKVMDDSIWEALDTIKKCMKDGKERRVPMPTGAQR